MECCLLPLAHLQQSLPIFSPHEAYHTLFLHFFLFLSFLFFHHSIKTHHHSQHSPNHLSLASSLNLNKSQGGNVPGGSRVEQGSKRRMKSEPMHRSFLSPTLIDVYSISERWSRTSHTHWHRQCVIYRSRYRRRQGCKNKTEKRPLVPETYSRWLHLDYWNRDITPIVVLSFRPIVNNKR